MKGVIFVNGRYTKGVPFLSKMVHKRLRGSMDLGALGGHCGFQVTGMIEGDLGRASPTYTGLKCVLYY